MLAKRFSAAAAGFIGGGLLGMISLALIVSIFDLAFRNVMPAALVIGSICALVAFYVPGFTARLVELFG